MSNLKVALCAIGRLENLYAREFVEYYKNLGVDHIYIYDNNHFNEEFFQDVLQDYIDQGFVEIIDFRGIVQAQNKAYNDCYLKHGNEYDWICYLDIDEYIVLEKHKNIQEFLKDKNDYEVVLINWKCMTDNNLIEYDDRPLMERFTEECPKNICVQYAFPENMHVKSIVKGGLPNVKFYSNPHLPTNPLLCCNADGVRCDNSPFQPITWETAYLKHFVTKSLEEWIKNKMKRGTGDRTYEIFLKTYAGRYWKYNKRTNEKTEWLKRNNIDTVFGI